MAPYPFRSNQLHRAKPTEHLLFNQAKVPLPRQLPEIHNALSSLLASDRLPATSSLRQTRRRSHSKHNQYKHQQQTTPLLNQQSAQSLLCRRKISHQKVLHPYLRSRNQQHRENPLRSQLGTSVPNQQNHPHHLSHLTNESLW
jgi:hypothetical protein